MTEIATKSFLNEIWDKIFYQGVLIELEKVDYEKQISIEYLRSLNEAYNNFFFKYNETPLLVINTTEIDFVNNEEDLNDLVEQILHPPVGMKYYVPRKG